MKARSKEGKAEESNKTSNISNGDVPIASLIRKDTEEKIELWDEIVKVMDAMGVPMMVGGDFNEVVMGDLPLLDSLGNLEVEE
ncbi:hypothetical protein PIB30_026923 [Stylosanthes scabra]|uniref:Uncharacterized protein n=1 Tax=Stylosanthes scabra TaxID=79078 RepID=A0ABU6X8W6_9FABA|nr:hypothetical protein [Stylosanthes scabra]